MWLQRNHGSTSAKHRKHDNLGITKPQHHFLIVEDIHACQRPLTIVFICLDDLQTVLALHTLLFIHFPSPNGPIATTAQKPVFTVVLDVSYDVLVHIELIVFLLEGVDLYNT